MQQVQQPHAVGRGEWRQPPQAQTKTTVNQRTSSPGCLRATPGPASMHLPPRGTCPPAARPGPAPLLTSLVLTLFRGLNARRQLLRHLLRGLAVDGAAKLALSLHHLPLLDDVLVRVRVRVRVRCRIRVRGRVGDRVRVRVS